MTATKRIEDYALIGSLRTAALVARDGAVDWLCVPRFDSPACFAALVGAPRNGSWRIAPVEAPRTVRRRYIEGTLVLETTFETGSGAVTLTDFMPIGQGHAEHLVRIIHGERGEVPMHLDLTPRFDYGHVVPWMMRVEKGIRASAGPDAIELHTPLHLELEGGAAHLDFSVRQGQTVPLVMSWYPSYMDPPRPAHADDLLKRTVDWWRDWSGRCQGPEEWHEAVVRSAITLKALVHRETGAVVAAPTTSLPEQIGGPRNWDYRFSWLRDATFTHYALTASGYWQEAEEWRQWLRRAIAGEPSQLQIMYGITGERRLDENTLPWLSGYDGSAPVRVGNGAYGQRQLDVFGEVMDAFHAFRKHGLEVEDDIWELQCGLMDFVTEHWQEPGAGLWEQRGDPRCFVTSQVMCWVAADRALKSLEQFGLKGPAEKWRRLRNKIHETVCRKGYDQERGAFVAAYGEKSLDASVLLMSLVGFLPATDERVVNTIEAVHRELTENGFVRRYRGETDDGFPEGEATFLVCTGWLADNLALIGREGEARDLYEGLLDVRNDVGLLAEEYDPVARRQLGNFPQAFSHVGIINTANNLAKREGGSHGRSRH